MGEVPESERVEPGSPRSPLVSVSSRVTATAERAWAGIAENARTKRFPAVLLIGWRDALIPVLAFVSSFAWLGVGTSYLYGQDSYSFVLPFSYQNSPFVASHYNAQSLYTFVLIDGFTRATGSPFAAERLVLAAFVGLAALGCVQLFRVINLARGRPAGSAWLGKLLGTAVFVWNPFTLSVAWQHVEGWTFFPVLLPFALALLFEVHYLGVSFRRIALTLLVGLPLAPGAAGTYLFILGYAFAFFVGLELVLAVARRARPRVAATRIAVYLLADLLLSGWASVQYFGSPLIPTASPGSLQNLFVAESGTTSLINVLTLTAYAPIQYAPSYFPWIGFLPALEFAGLLLVLVTTVLIAHATGGRISVVWAALTLPIVVTMTGANFPGGPLNSRLLAIGGPFDVLVNPYYFLAPYYCAFLAYVVYRTTDEVVPVLGTSPLLRRLRERLPLARRPRPAAAAAAPPTARAPARGARDPLAFAVTRPVAVGTLAMIVVAVALFVQPFAAGEVYQPHGGFLSEESVPADYPALAQFFANDYPGPIYNVLILPTSSDGATYHAYNGDNSTFPDSEGLLASYIPYPTIWRYPQGTLLTSESPLYGAVENVTANLSGTPQGIGGLLDAIHVRYVVVDQQYVPRKSMLFAPNGAPYDLGAVERGLNGSLGAPTAVGRFLVYTNPVAAPLVTATSFPDTLAAPSLADYLGLVSTLPANSNVGFLGALRSAVWSPDPLPGGFSMRPYSGGSLSLPVPSGTSPVFVGANGSFENSSPGASVDAGVLRLAPDLVAAGNLSNAYAVTPTYRDGCYLAGNGASNVLAMSRPVHGWPVFSASVSVNLSDPADLLSLRVDVGPSLHLSMDLQNHGSSGFVLAGVERAGNASAFGWNNTPFEPSSAFAGPLNVTISLTSTALTVRTVSTADGAVTDALYYGIGTVPENGGHNVLEYPNVTGFDPAQLGSWINWTFAAGTSVCAPTLEEAPPVRDVLFAPPVAALASVASRVTASGTGAYIVQVDTSNRADVYLGMLSTSTGDWEATGATGALASVVGSNPFHLYRASVPLGVGSMTFTVRLVNHVPLAIDASLVQLAGVAGFSVVLAVAAVRPWRPRAE